MATFLLLTCCASCACRSDIYSSCYGLLRRAIGTLAAREAACHERCATNAKKLIPRSPRPRIPSHARIFTARLAWSINSAIGCHILTLEFNLCLSLSQAQCSSEELLASRSQHMLCLPFLSARKPLKRAKELRDPRLLFTVLRSCCCWPEGCLPPAFKVMVCSLAAKGRSGFSQSLEVHWVIVINFSNLRIERYRNPATSGRRGNEAHFPSHCGIEGEEVSESQPRSPFEGL
ncbi:hypothetical protein BJ875DRAFT_217366 [Amylocarpus encephaloides]|uniref:Secreted protein n=1 Tax=Amylocarpus encephaloides TaxID=45428 RepID=A0A9P7YNZ4_9HELO|nr:hypothetical protein BJ875DRAFT_217366 [Amylocarpus encephaloides]